MTRRNFISYRVLALGRQKFKVQPGTLVSLLVPCQCFLMDLHASLEGVVFCVGFGVCWLVLWL